MFYFLFILTFVLCLGDSLISSNYKLSFKFKMLNLDRNLEKGLSFFMYLLTFLLITANRFGVDIINYNNIYVREPYFSSLREPIYTFFRVVAYNVGLSFYEFRAILTFVTALFPILLINKLGVKPSFFLTLYLPSLLFLDSMQFRNAVALYILTWATWLLIHSNTWKSKAMFLLCVIFAAQFHTAFIVYFIILIATFRYKKIYISAVFGSSTLLVLMTYFNGREIPLINVVYSMLLNQGDSRGYTYASGHLIFLYPTFVHIITTLILIYFSSKVVFENQGDEIKWKYIQLIKDINIIFFVFIPFIIMNTTYYRLLRNGFLFNIIAEGVIFSLEKNRFRRISIIITMLMVSILWLLFTTKVYSSWEIIVDPILRNGVFFWMD